MDLDGLADRVAGALPATEGISTAYLAGSIVEGFGNESSDVDVIVVHETDLALPDSDYVDPRDGHTMATWHWDDARVDVEGWQAATVTRLVRALGARGGQEPIASTESHGFLLSELELLHSLRIGRPVLGQETLAEMREQLEGSRHTEVMFDLHMTRYSGNVEDAVGALRSNDVGSAWLSAGIALDNAVDALTSRRGETNPKARWRLRKLERLGEHELGWGYTRAMGAAVEDAKGLAVSAERRLRLAHKVAQRAHDAAGGELG